MTINSEQLDEAYGLLGRIAVHLSMAEYQMEQLIVLYLGEDTGPLVVAELGRNKDKSELLRSLISHLEKDDELKVRLIALIRAYSVARENRNILLHSFILTQNESGTLVLQRSSSSPAIPIARLEAPIEDIREVHISAEAIKNKATLFWVFKAQELGHQVLRGSIRIALPEPPPLPRKLKDIDPLVVASSLSQLRKRES